MSQIIPIDIMDGNQYLINATTNKAINNSQDVTFDEVYNNKTESLEDIFQDVANEYGVSVKLLKAVAQAESSFDTNAVSSCGASGIMQLMPATAKSLGVEDVFDARQNITGGAKMLAYLLDDYNGDTTLALAAYNAGSGAVQKYGGVPPYEETQNYIKKINNILGEDSDTDTSNISIQKKSSGVISAGSNSSNVISTSIPVKIVNTQTQAAEAFTYERYLEFLELYQKLLSVSIIDSNTDAMNNSEDNNDFINSSLINSSNLKTKSLYELQQAKYNSRAMSLLGLEL